MCQHKCVNVIRICFRLYLNLVIFFLEIRVYFLNVWYRNVSDCCLFLFSLVYIYLLHQGFKGYEHFYSNVSCMDSNTNISRI
jgi:hypothetical protein